MSVTYTRSAEQAITISLDGLANNGYATSAEITPADTDVDHHIRVTIANVAEAVNKMVLFFLICSIDGTTFETSEADGNMRPLDFADMTNSSGDVVKVLSVAEAAPGGILPKKYKLVAKNLTNVALAGSGNSAGYSAISVA